MDDDHLPVDDRLAGKIEGTGNRRKALRPVQPVAGVDLLPSAVDEDLDAVSERGVYSDQDANVAPGENRRGTCWRGISSGYIRAENRVELFRWRAMTALGFRRR